jgi:hypothetical protein
VENVNGGFRQVAVGVNGVPQAIDRHDSNWYFAGWRRAMHRVFGRYTAALAAAGGMIQTGILKNADHSTPPI